MDGSNPIKASDLLVRALESEGVERVFAVPGEENLDLLESLGHSSIEVVVARHEQAAGFMAATYGRFTGNTGVCLATLGPGATNLVTAAAYAQLGAMPMLMITGQKPVKRSKQGRFQILDVVEMMRPVTKFTHQLLSADNLPARTREAFRLAEEERPGAVHLELPEDVAAEIAEGRPIAPSATRRPIAEEKSIARAVEMIESAERPLLLIGAGANRKRTSRMLRRFVHTTGIPFISTQMGKGVIDETSEHYVGNATLSDRDILHRAIEHADLIINVGHDVVEKPPFFMRVDDTRRVIHVNFFSAAVDTVYFPQLEVVGDIANAIWQMDSRVRVPDHWDFARFREVRDAVETHLQNGSDDARFPVYPQRLVADVARVLADESILALDNGMFKIWFARNYRARFPNTVLLDNALASMGAGLPSAMAAKMVFPERRVLAVCGDGGFMMNSQELETAVRLGLHLVILLIRDDAYGMIRWKQEQMQFADQGLSFGNPDFVSYAQSYGARGHRLETAEELVPLIRACFDDPAVHLIDVPIDYSENNAILNEQIPRIAATI